MKEELKEILKMIRDGVISVDEAERLFDAFNEGNKRKQADSIKEIYREGDGHLSDDQLCALYGLSPDEIDALLYGADIYRYKTN